MRKIVVLVRWIKTVFQVSTQSLLVILAMVGIGASARVEAGVIVGISIPVGSSDATSHPHDSGIWSVSAAGAGLPITSGIGYLVNPALLEKLPPPPPRTDNAPDFSLHDHVYVSANVPDPSRAVVTYQFDVPTVVSDIEIIQHHNGISQIEGFYGNSPGSLNSLGSVFGPLGDTTGPFTEGADQVFEFGNTTNAGTFFQFVIRKTTLTDGYAAYRAFPLDQDARRIPAVPEPHSLILLGLGLLSLFGYAWRRRTPAHRSGWGNDTAGTVAPPQATLQAGEQASPRRGRLFGSTIQCRKVAEFGRWIHATI